MEKMKTAVAAEVRKSLYEVALRAIAQEGMTTEIVKDGALIHLPDGYFAKLKVTVCDATKFDLEAERVAYQEKLDKAAARAQEAAAKAEEKARKAAEREQKRAAKETEAE